jgi:hypothetical protein
MTPFVAIAVFRICVTVGRYLLRRREPTQSTRQELAD